MLRGATRFEVNDADASELVVPPYELDIGKWVRAGDNNIEVLVYNTLRNHMHTVLTNFCCEVSPRRG